MEKFINWLMMEWGAKDYYLTLAALSMLFMLIALIDRIINRQNRAFDMSILSVIFCAFSIVAMIFFGTFSLSYVSVVFMTLLATAVGLYIMADNATSFLEIFYKNNFSYIRKNVMYCMLYFILILSSTYVVF